MAKVADFYRSLGYEEQKIIARLLHYIVDMPLVEKLYQIIYQRVIDQKTKGLPRTITIETCNICNIMCVMCPYSSMTRKKETMSMDIYTRIVDDAVRIGIQELSLTNYGEPLLDRFIFNRIEYAKSKGMRVGFTSNGTLLESAENTTRLIKSNIDWVEVSIDGITKQTYEKIRKGANFDDVVAGFIKLCKEKGPKKKTPKIGVSCCVQVENLAEIRSKKKDFNRLFKEADYVVFGPILKRGIIGEPLPASKDFRLPLKSARHIYPCRLPFDNLLVLVDGSVTLCCMDYDGKIRLGNLRNTSIENVWNSEQYMKIRTSHLEGNGRFIGICENCKKLDVSDFIWWQ